jgi:cytochrome c oxidase assembly protein subunit 15
LLTHYENIGLDFLIPEQRFKEIASKTSSESVAVARRMKKPALIALALVATTAVSGAFVAGNDAGRAYNTFPLMGDSFMPPVSEMFKLSPTWRNFFETTATVQFDHRLLAYSSVLLIGGTSLMAFRSGHFKSLPKGLSHSVKGAALMVTTQATLGVSAILTYVPIWLGAIHQVSILLLDLYLPSFTTNQACHF